MLVTGGAGFIGSHIVHQLILDGQRVRVLDNFSSGKKVNLDIAAADQKCPDQLEIIEGDIRDHSACSKAMEGVTHLCHHAAVISVPHSIEDPILYNEVNNNGFLNLLEIARKSTTLKRIVYASSSAVFGDRDQSKGPDQFQPLSPYAASKLANEFYAAAFAKSFNISIFGLRYYNVFGERQNVSGAYASVIPKWIQSLILKNELEIYGDGSATRDFCYVKDVARVNLRILFSNSPMLSAHSVLNVASGRSISVKMLAEKLIAIAKNQNKMSDFKIIYGPARTGDILLSVCSGTTAFKLLEVDPQDLDRALKATFYFYIK